MMYSATKRLSVAFSQHLTVVESLVSGAEVESRRLETLHQKRGARRMRGSVRSLPDNFHALRRSAFASISPIDDRNTPQVRRLESISRWAPMTIRNSLSRKLRLRLTAGSATTQRGCILPPARVAFGNKYLSPRGDKWTPPYTNRDFSPSNRG